MSPFILAAIILAPTLGAIFLGLLYVVSIRYKKVSKLWFMAIGLSTPLVSFILSLVVFSELLSGTERIVYDAYKWVHVGNFDITMSLMVDHLSLFMILFVTFIGWLIHLYAAGYMEDDEGFGKFFFYFNLFLASMLLLVLANSPVIMFIGWEGVGVCSYFLISYYYKDAQNVVAGNKAFIANRVGDFGFIVAMSTLFFYVGENGFDYAALEQNITHIPLHVKTFIGVMFFVGAMGKSAQIPLYVWLPDAMAGPTPVSALIHAATMVTAGVYMVARFGFLYNEIPDVGLYIAYVGAFSSLFAAVIATKQSDIKKILAYSTMSQLGYMFVAAGLGAYGAGIFHVFTHAFFKALLFMGAGAVIVALHHEQNIFKMGGMRRETPLVYVTMLIATLAICGVPPFAGFFSKDEILLTAFSTGNYLLWAMGVATAILTAYYMFRLFFTVFEGSNASRGKVHKIPIIMKAPLVVLAVGSIGAGWIGIPEALGGTNMVHHWLEKGSITLPHISHSMEYMLMLINVLAAGVGIYIAWQRFGHYDYTLEEQKEGMVYHKFYVDEVYDKVFVRSIQNLSTFIGQTMDLVVIDGSIMATCKGFVKTGWMVSILQNANARAYAFAILVGVSVFSLYMIGAM